MRIRRSIAATTAAVMAASALAMPAGAATAVKAPKGKYEGVTEQQGQIQFKISKNRKYVSLVVFNFSCGEDAVGATGLKNLKLKKTKKGYKFGDGAQSSVAYNDDTNEEGTVAVVGRFSKNAKAVTGAFQVETERCGDSGAIKYIATK